MLMLEQVLSKKPQRWVRSRLVGTRRVGACTRHLREDAVQLETRDSSAYGDAD